MAWRSTQLYSPAFIAKKYIIFLLLLVIMPAAFEIAKAGHPLMASAAAPHTYSF
jgi:hypothetical protein